MSRSLTNDDIAVITAHWIDKTLDDGEYDVDYMNHSKELPQQFIDAHADTYFDVVTETLAGSPWSNSTHKPNPSWWQEIFFTEKTFRCIMNMRPFILFGNQHSLLKLKEWGFRTFDGVLWNEEYDWISNGEEVKLKRPELAGGDDSNLLDANVENVKKENTNNFSIMIGYDKHPLRRKESWSQNSCFKIFLRVGSW